MSLSTIIIYSSTSLSVIYYIPQLYSIYIKKSFNLYDLPPQFIMCMTSGCLTWYSVLIEDNELLISSSIILGLNVLELGCMGYYAYFNMFETIPHERFSQRNINLEVSNECL